jgi:hypothetical protein
MLSLSFFTVLSTRGGLDGSEEDMVKQHLLFFCCFMVSIGGGVGRFVPVVMVVEREDGTGAWSFQILMSFSHLCYIVLCIN